MLDATCLRLEQPIAHCNEMSHGTRQPNYLRQFNQKRDVNYQAHLVHTSQTGPHTRRAAPFLTTSDAMRPHVAIAVDSFLESTHDGVSIAVARCRSYTTASFLSNALVGRC